MSEHVENTNLNPLRLEGFKFEDVEALRKRIHECVDAMLDKVEYDVHGDAVNRIIVTQAQEFVTYPVMAETLVRLPGDTTLTLKVEPTFRAVQEEIARLGQKKVAEAERESKGFTTYLNRG